jgi:hypothetical protein
VTGAAVAAGRPGGGPGGPGGGVAGLVAVPGRAWNRGTMRSGAIVTRRLYLSVGLAVGGAIVLMAGWATVLVGEARRLESARGWPSLTSLGTVLIGCGFALGVAFAAVTIAGLRGGGRRRAGRGPALAEADSFPGRGDYWPEPGPRTGMTLPGGWAGGSAAEVGGDSGAFGLDDRGVAEDRRGPGEASPVSVTGSDDSGDGTRAEDWLSHLRGSGLGPVHQPGRAASPEPPAASPVPAPPVDYGSLASPAAGYGSHVPADYRSPVSPDRPGYGAPAGPPPSAAPAGHERPVAPRPASYGSPARPNPAGYGAPADYADEGWRLDGADWAESHGHHATAQPTGAPEIHHPAPGRRHDTGQQPAHDTGQWRAFELDQPPADRAT